MSESYKLKKIDEIEETDDTDKTNKTNYIDTTDKTYQPDKIDVENYIYAGKNARAVFVDPGIKFVIISNCPYLEEIELSNTEKCFINNCPKLQSLKLPRTIQHLDINNLNITSLNFDNVPKLISVTVFDCPKLVDLYLQKSDIQNICIKRCENINICNLPKKMKSISIEDTPITEMKIPNVLVFKLIGTNVKYLDLHPGVLSFHLNKNKNLIDIPQPISKQRNVPINREMFQINREMFQINREMFQINREMFQINYV